MLLSFVGLYRLIRYFSSQKINCTAQRKAAVSDVHYGTFRAGVPNLFCCSYPLCQSILSTPKKIL